MESIFKVKNQIEQYQKLLWNICESGKCSSIDKDLLLEKLREIYEVVLSIEPQQSKQTDNSLKVVKQIEKNEEIIVEEMTEKEFEEEMIKDTPIELNEPLPSPKVPKHYDDDLLLRIDDIQTDIIIPEIVEKEIIIEKPQIIADKPNVSEIQIVKQTSNSGESLASKLNHTKVESIAGAMSLGDKMMFQKQLFKDRNGEFLKTLESLNDLESFEEAVAWLQASYSWNFESPIVKKFLDIVQRRF